MKSAMHIDWKTFQQEAGFSPVLSSKRLQLVQETLTRNKAEFHFQSAVLSILGVDSRYSEGSKELANFLLFDFYEKYEFHLQKCGVPEEETDDVLLVIKPASVHVYCTQSMYQHLLPYIGHWSNLSIYCYVGDDSLQTYEEDVEEYKVQSLVAMLQGTKKVYIPYFSQTMLQRQTGATFDVFAIEKWPLIQAYAVEGVGRGMFFTMEFEVDDISGELHSLYRSYDPSALQKVVCNALPLFERHWYEAMNVINGNSTNGSHRVAVPSVTEGEVAESMKSYFRHGRLSSAAHHRNNSKTATTTQQQQQNLPFVRFGTNTKTMMMESSGNDCSLSNAKHMVLHSVSPKIAISCTRTYFVRQTESDNDYQLLIAMYQAVVESCHIIIEEYCSHQKKDNALNVGKLHLINTLGGSCFTPLLSLEAIDCNGNFTADLPNGERNMYLKKVCVTICDVTGNDGNHLGNISYCDTFLDSTLSVLQQNDSDSVKSNAVLMLTQAIPVCAEWQVDEIKSYKSRSVVSCDRLYLCSSSPFHRHNEACELVYYEDGTIGISPFNSPAFHLKPETIKEMSFFNPSVQQDACHLLQIEVHDAETLPPLLRTTNPDKAAVFAVAFYPNTTALQTFMHKVHPSLSTVSSYCSITPQISKHLIPSYNQIQEKYEWLSRSVLSSSRLTPTASSSLQPQYKEFMKHMIGNYAAGSEPITEKNLRLLLSDDKDKREPQQPAGGNTENAASKVCVTVITGLPGSHAERMCSSLVAVNRERVRWVVIKCKCEQDGNSFHLDQQNLQKTLADVVSKRRSTRPGAAATKRLRIIIECVGFFRLSDVVSCITDHPDDVTRAAMSLGCVTACIEPLSCVVQHKLLFPTALDHCADEYVSCIAFTGKKHNVKDKSLLDMQSLTRMTNPHAAFLLAERGHMSRPGDFEMILSDSSFSDTNLARTRILKQSHISTHPAMHASFPIREIDVPFSQPLIKGSFKARLRALHNTLKGYPYTGNIYFMHGVVAFTDKPEQFYDVTYSSTTGDLNLEPKEQQQTMMNAPAPPPPNVNVPAPPSSGKPNPTITSTKPFHLLFHGIDITEGSLKDWLRKSGKQKPMKKNHRTAATISTSEKKRIQKMHETDELPEGFFFNGTQYCSLLDSTKTYIHPCLDKFIEEYLRDENRKVDAYNARLQANSMDMFT